MALQDNEQRNSEPHRPTVNHISQRPAPKPVSDSTIRTIVAVAVAGAIAIAILIARVSSRLSSDSSTSWKTITCAQWMHDSYSEQQQLFNEMQPSYKYYNDNSPLSFGSLQSTCDEEGTVTLNDVAGM